MEIKFLEKGTSYHEVCYEIEEEMIERSSDRIKKLIKKHKTSKLTQDEARELYDFVSIYCYINSSELLDIDDYEFEKIKDYEE